MKENNERWDWNVFDDQEQAKNLLIDSKRKQYETDLLYHSVFNNEEGTRLLNFLQENIVNKIGYNANFNQEKAYANMLIRDAQAMLVQAFQNGVQKINKAPNIEEYVKL